MFTQNATDITNRNIITLFEIMDTRSAFKSSIKKVFSQGSSSNTWFDSCSAIYEALLPYSDGEPNKADQDKIDVVFDALKKIVGEINQNIAYYKETNKEEMLSPFISDTESVLPKDLCITNASEADIELELRKHASNVVTGDFDITNPSVESLSEVLTLACITHRIINDDFDVSNGLYDLSVYSGEDYAISFDFGIDDPQHGTNIVFTMEGDGVEVEGHMHYDSDENFFFSDTDLLQKHCQKTSESHTPKDINIFHEIALKGESATSIFHSLHAVAKSTVERIPFIDDHLKSIKIAALSDLIEIIDNSSRKEIMSSIKGCVDTDDLMHSLLKKEFDTWVSYSTHQSEYLLSTMDKALDRIKRELDWGDNEILDAVCAKLISTQSYNSKEGDLSKTLSLVAASNCIPFDRDSYDYLQSKISSSQKTAGKDLQIVTSGLSSKYLEVTVEKKMEKAGSKTRVIQNVPVSF